LKGVCENYKKKIFNLQILSQQIEDISQSMSLFIGNISRNVEQKTMEATLNSFGPCKIEFRVILNKVL